MQENEVYYAIPSYLRSENQDTLDYLLDMGVSRERIFIFVQTRDDYDKYSEMYSEKCNVVYREANSVSQARNNILEYFGGAVNILMMDDDISGLFTGAKGEGLAELGRDKFEEIIETTFRLARRLRGELFGYYPVDNDYFMNNTVSTKKPVNTVIGFPKGFSERFDESFVAKEDIELCGRIMRRGGNIVRFNNITFKAKHRTNKGGCYEDWKSGVNEEIAKRLSTMYPGIYAVKKNNKREVRTAIADNVKGLKRWEN